MTPQDQHKGSSDLVADRCGEVTRLEPLRLPGCNYHMGNARDSAPSRKTLMGEVEITVNLSDHLQIHSMGFFSICAIFSVSLFPQQWCPLLQDYR